MVEIKPGPELDKAVADAVDMVYAGYCRRGPMYCLPGEESNLKKHLEIGIEWSPSTDLNAAFAAAEKAASSDRGFGDWELSTYIGRNEKGWTCQIGDCSERSFAPTPALAICEAILKSTGT